MVALSIYAEHVKIIRLAIICVTAWEEVVPHLVCAIVKNEAMDDVPDFAWKT